MADRDNIPDEPKITITDVQEHHQSAVKKRQSTLIILFIILAPILIASAILANRQLWQRSHAFQGTEFNTLISMDGIHFTDQDGTDITVKNFIGKWTLLYLNPTVCRESCLSTLRKLQTLRYELGPQSSRLNRVIVSRDSQEDKNPMLTMLKEQYPSIKYLTIDKTNLDKFFAALPENTQSENIDKLYLLNPRGELVMTYNSSVPSSGLVGDIKKTLGMKIGQ